MIRDKERTIIRVEISQLSLPSRKDGLKEWFMRYRQIRFGVIGGKSGRTILIPIWFVPDRDKLCKAPRPSGTRTCFRTRR